MIDITNFKEVLGKYAADKYGEDKFTEFHDLFYNEFPYKKDNLDPEQYIRNFVDWLIYEKKLPETSKTIVEEYIDEHPELEESIKQSLLRTMKVISSKFVVISKKGLALTIKDFKSGECYQAMFQNNFPNIGRNTMLIGRIHPFGDTYVFAGVFGVYNSPMILDPDIMMNAYEEGRIKDAEKIILSESTKLTAVLNKYPGNWVNGICNGLSIDAKGKKNIKAQLIAEKLNADMSAVFSSLPDKSKEALRMILDSGGSVNYGKLKEYDDQISFFWETPPQSTIGVLRAKGLLVVGKMPQKGKMYKVALIPKDIREAIISQMKK